MYDDSPIAAISTAEGKGAIGIVRISGKDLSLIMLNLFGRILNNRHVYYLPFKNKNNYIIDKGIVFFCKSPESYTGEDVLELQGHGGNIVIHEILSMCLDAGAENKIRLANPGEFTKRAFLNGRIDLAQAEAISDLIDAVSIEAAKSAMLSLSGEPSKRIHEITEELIKTRVIIEANIDFPEEDIIFIQKKQILESLEQIKKNLLLFIETTKKGIIIKNGINVVIAGEPNVGKSSILNALSEEEIAIVTPIAGTTRDKISNKITINGILINIIDTAGIRESNDQIEKIGIRKSLEEISKADLILHIKDISNQNNNDNLIKFPSNTPVLEIFNKIDLVNKIANNDNILFVSATEKIGIDSIKNKILEIVGLDKLEETRWIARERHLFSLNQSLEHLKTSLDYLSEQELRIDLIAEELRLSHKELCYITGHFTTENMLDNIFSNFCIGK
ncbi:tRNA modification GTPase [Candidatus Kinetoplastibacterium desouzaii TCC079E]|uniref:tRNA modification GTPase MnmE n=2 Tax=Candidatus Kinetoplastidibacterium desouzai TaxID=994692 RepID=M1M562_9PROT|nr:tRNA modification GTPase [Candidatus Kinetoplastibacterium desouzaii TCC079E]